MRRDPDKVKIEKGVTIPLKEAGFCKYPKIFQASRKMKHGDSCLFETYYHASALSSYLKQRRLIAPIRVIRDDTGERQGWRVWALDAVKEKEQHDS